jgi:hypothetical protein
MLPPTFSLLIALLVIGCSSARPDASIRAEAKAAMSQLHVGMTEDAALAILKPVALDWGRGLLYFRVSRSQQFCLEISAGPEFKITRVGVLEPKRKWMRDSNGGMSVR